MQYKSSKQRDLVLSYMKNIQGHVSAEQIYQDLNEIHPFLWRLCIVT